MWYFFCLLIVWGTMNVFTKFCSNPSDSSQDFPHWTKSFPLMDQRTLTAVPKRHKHTTRAAKHTKSPGVLFYIESLNQHQNIPGTATHTHTHKNPFPFSETHTHPVSPYPSNPSVYHQWLSGRHGKEEQPVQFAWFRWPRNRS